MSLLDGVKVINTIKELLKPPVVIEYKNGLMKKEIKIIALEKW